MKIIIKEDQFDTICGAVLSEQKVYTNFDSVYDYRLENDKWYTRRKSKPDGKWINITHLSVAVNKLNAKYGTNVQSTGKKPRIEPKPITPSDYLKPPDVKQDQIPSIQPKRKLKFADVIQPEEPYDPLNHIDDEIPTENPLVKSDLIAEPYKDKIDFDSLPSNKEVGRICTPDTNECAEFVNNFSDKIGYIGDAWLAHDTDKVGKRIYSSYFDLPENIIDYYFRIYVAIKNGADEAGIAPHIRKLQTDIIKSKPQPTNLKVDDIVGLYNKDSNHNKEAFVGSSTYGKGYYSDGRKGRALTSGRGHSLNTHVGIVGAIKDGVPLVFHNVLGNVKSTPANQLPIVWVKRQT